MRLRLAALAATLAPLTVSATPSATAEPAALIIEKKVQGKGVEWWARRVVQARKDANVRGHTIQRLQHAQLRASFHFFDWLAAADCVHHYEGSWTDPNPPYFGGMQADLDFQRAYGADHFRRWGTANRWPWWAQMEMAYRGWLFRGWNPWPNTARKCGLF